MRQRTVTPGRIGLLVGILAAIVLFGALAGVLGAAQVSSVRVLAAVWLMALPLLGVAALAGWAVAAMLQLAVRQRRGG